MILPENPKKLTDAVFEQLWYCTRSMGQRENAYNRRESMYRKGATGVVRGRLNKAGPAIDKQAALLFVPHLLKFAARVPPEETDEEVFSRVDAVCDAAKLAWRDLDMEVIFPMAITWALVDSLRILSVLPQIKTNGEVELRADMIHPKDFGVGRENGAGSWSLERQQSMVVRSYHTMEEMDRWLRLRPDRNELMSRLEFIQIDAGERGSRITGMAPGATILQAKPDSWPSVTGDGDDTPTRVAVKFHELRLFDDDLGDWRAFTISGDVILRDIPATRIGVPGMPPYIKICPDEDPESFWGISNIEKISPLQEWYLNRMEGMDEKFRQSLRPPTAAIGLGQSFEEKIAAFRRAGGRIAIPNQNARIEQFKAEISDSDFAMMSQIAEQLNDQAQLSPLLRGRNEPGVRGQEMLNTLAKLASGEILVKSLRIEGQAKKMINLIFHSLRRYSTAKLRDANGKLFMMAEFPADVDMEVDGHSSSPILIEDHKQDAKYMLQMGLIKPSRAIRYISPVMEDSILHELNDIELIKAQVRHQIETEMKRSGKEKAGVGHEA